MRRIRGRTELGFGYHKVGRINLAFHSNLLLFMIRRHRRIADSYYSVSARNSCGRSQEISELE